MASKSQGKAVIVLSGGLDSFTLLHALHRGDRCLDYERWDLFPLTLRYGQRHEREIEYARRACESLGLPHRIVDLTDLQKLAPNSALTGEVPVPHGHYAEESMKQTVVPARNMVLLSLGVAYAGGMDATMVFIGAHSGDHPIYPDCRPAFLNAIAKASTLAHFFPIRIRSPFRFKSKADIVGFGIKMGLDYSQAWTCYEGGETPCGECGACVERAESFALNNAVDPLVGVGS